MSWDYKTSYDRIKEHLDKIGEIEIERLVKEADLNNLLSEKRCREIFGAHVYLEVSNFARLATEGNADREKYKRLIQSVHVYQREVARIVEKIFEGLRVHFQGAKLHALFYRPIGDARKQAVKAFFLLLVLKDFVAHVFNPAFPFYDDFTVAGGSDIGDVIGTRNGTRADRELLFLGAPANYAAKIIAGASKLRITAALYASLPEDLQDCCEETEDEDVYLIKNLSVAELDALLEKYRIDWDREKSAARVEEDKKNFPLKYIEYSSANTLIDLDVLSIHNNKRVLAASLFGDVTGFTAFIDAADTNEKKRRALRVLHAIRKEMALVVKKDFEGLRVQFQGDRVQGLFHLPKDEEAEIAEEAVDAAVGLQSSMEKTIKEILPEAGALRLAVGVDIDKTLVSKLGTRAHRDRICLGKSVECAAETEEKCSGGQIGISKRVYDALSERLKRHFSYDTSLRCYVAENLTADVVARAENSAKAVPGAPAFIRSENGATSVSPKESDNARTIIPARNFAAEE